MSPRQDLLFSISVISVVYSNFPTVGRNPVVDVYLRSEGPGLSSLSGRYWDQRGWHLRNPTAAKQCQQTPYSLRLPNPGIIFDLLWFMLPSQVKDNLTTLVEKSHVHEAELTLDVGVQVGCTNCSRTCTNLRYNILMYGTLWKVTISPRLYMKSRPVHPWDTNIMWRLRWWPGSRQLAVSRALPCLQLTAGKGSTIIYSDEHCRSFFINCSIHCAFQNDDHVRKHCHAT